MLSDLSLKAFIQKTASPASTPAGGSISALCGALAAALCEMIAHIKWMKKKEEGDPISPTMKTAHHLKETLFQYIDMDANAYGKILTAFRLPQSSEKEKEMRNSTIQEAALEAIEIPLSISGSAIEVMDLALFIADNEKSELTADVLVSALIAQGTAVGALYCAEANLCFLKDIKKKESLRESIQTLHDEALRRKIRFPAFKKEK